MKLRCNARTPTHEWSVQTDLVCVVSQLCSAVLHCVIVISYDTHVDVRCSSAYGHLKKKKEKELYKKKNKKELLKTRF